MNSTNLNKVAKYRAEKGWTMDELEERSGVTKSTIHRIESGKVRPNLATLGKLAKALGVNIELLAEDRTSGPTHHR